MVISHLIGQTVSFNKEPYMMYQNEVNTADPDDEYHSTLEKLLVRWQLTEAPIGTTVTCFFTYSDGINNPVTIQANNILDEIWQVSLNLVVNLDPSTKYSYQVIVYEDGILGPDPEQGTFLTPPLASETSVTFYGYGDTRGNSSGPPQYHNAVCEAILDEFSSSNDPDSQTFLLHDGDWNNGDSEASWDIDYFCDTHDKAIELRANLPIMGG